MVFSATAKGAIGGGIAGATLGLIGISAAGARFHAFRQMRLPFKTFLVIMPAAFAGKHFVSNYIWLFIGRQTYCKHVFKYRIDVLISFAGFVTAEKYSRNYLASQHHGLLFGEQFKDTASRMHDEALAQKSTIGKLREWATVYRFPILGVSWVTSLTIAGILVSRDHNLTRTQKFGQARIYAQGLTVALVLALAGFTLGKDDEEGKWDTVLVVDPDDPEHKRMIEKKNLRERYKGQHLWKGMLIQSVSKSRDRQPYMLKTNL